MDRKFEHRKAASHRLPQYLMGRSKGKNMVKVELPTPAQIKHLLHYHPESGVFRWRFCTSSHIKPWDIAGTLRNDYLAISISNKKHYAHRLAWLYMTGNWPEQQIDHVDGVKSNNAWSNLREATNKQNNENQSIKSNNKSGFRGVHFDDKSQKWRAMVGNNGKSIHVGWFTSAEDAGKAAANK